MWICNPYILTYVCKPCRTWGWKIWQRYRIQYRLRQLSRRKYSTSNPNIHYSVNCQLRVKSVEADLPKKDRKIIKRKPKTKFKSKVKRSFQPKLDTIPELHSELGNESDIDLPSTKKTKNKFIRKKIKNKFSLNQKNPAAVVANKKGKIFATKDPEFETPKILSGFNKFTNCAEVSRADQETTTEFDTTMEMPKTDHSKITTPENSYSFLYDPVETLNKPNYVNDSVTAYCKTKYNGSLSLKQAQLVSGTDDCKKYLRLSKTNASRPSTSQEVNNQLDLQISKIIPQPRPKPTPREKYNKEENKIKDDNKYKYGHYGRLDTYKNKPENTTKPVSKLGKRIELLGDKMFDEMTPTKLEQNNKNRDISKHLYNIPTSAIESEISNNNNIPVQTFTLPEPHHNNMLYVLPIRNFPEAERNMQVVILHLDPSASRYLKPNEKENLVQPEQDEPWKKYLSEAKPCVKKLEDFTRSTFPKSRSENSSRSRRTNIETASNEGVKNKHKYNRKQNDVCMGSKKRKMEDEPVQTEISIYSTETQKYPEEFYKNIDRTGYVGLRHYPSFETFTIEENKEFNSFSCQTRVFNKEEVTQTAGESFYKKRSTNKYSKACNTIIVQESSNFSSQTLDNCEASLLKPQIYQYSGDNCPNALKNFVYAKYLNLDNNKNVFQPEETNTDISCSDQEDSTVMLGKNDKKIRNSVRRKSVNTITKAEPAKKLKENVYPHIQTILSGSVLEIRRQYFDKDTSTKCDAQDEALQTNISDKSIYRVIPNIDTDKSAQTLDYFTQVHPNPMYMVYYESNVYQNTKKLQTDLNCLCKESFVKCPYLSFNGELNQTNIQEDTVDYTNNENGDYLVPKYVIAEDQSSQTISRPICDCYTQETSHTNVEERLVQNKICQYNEPIHKAIEYNKKECRYFKTFKSGITKVASTSVSSTISHPENTNGFKKSNIEKLDVSKVAAPSVSSTCCNSHLFNKDISYKPCIKATSTSSSCICFCDDGSKLGNERIDASTKSSTFSHWGTSNNIKIAPTGISPQYSDSSNGNVDKNKENTETAALDIPSTDETYKSSSKIAATSVSSIFSHSGNPNLSNNLDITKVTATSISTTFSKEGNSQISKTCQCNLLEEERVFEKSNTMEEACSCCECSMRESELSKTKSVSTNEPVFQIRVNNKKENPKLSEQKMCTKWFKGNLNSKKMKNKSSNKLVQTDIPNYGTFVQMHEMGNCAATKLDKTCNCIETEDCMTSEHFKLNPTKIINNNLTCLCSKLPKQQICTRHKILQINICDYELGSENNEEFNEEGEFQIVVNSLLGMQNSSEFKKGSASITQNTIFQLDNLNLENNVKRNSAQKCVNSKRAKSA